MFIKTLQDWVWGGREPERGTSELARGRLCLVAWTPNASVASRCTQCPRKMTLFLFNYSLFRILFIRPTPWSRRPESKDFEELLYRKIGNQFDIIDISPSRLNQKMNGQKSNTFTFSHQISLRWQNKVYWLKVDMKIEKTKIANKLGKVDRHISVGLEKSV